MRPFFVLTGLLAVSIVVCAFLVRSNFNLRDKLASAEAELAIVNLARKADAEALEIAEQARSDAARSAQEARDALHKIEMQSPHLSDADLLCRLRGVCANGTEGGADAAGKSDAGMPRTNTTSSNAGGE